MQTHHTTKSHTFKAITASALAAMTLSLGCGSDAESLDAATFGGQSEQDLGSIVSVADGSLELITFFFALAFSGDEDGDGCPRVSTDGLVTTVEGGCTDSEGVTLEGSIKMTNVQFDLFAEDRPDPSADSLLELRAFTISFPDGDVVLDGTMRIGAKQGDGSITTESDVSLSATGVNPETGEAINESMGVDASHSCDGEGECRYESGASGYVTSVGSFDIAGSYSGLITLTGTNTMTFDLGSRDANGCIDVNVEGELEGSVCPPQDQ